MSKNYDMIATVDIDIATPIVDDTSFDNLLIMGPAPKTGAKSPARVGVYSDISEVEDAGFVTSGADADPVGLAASVAFAQSPRPTAVYIAVQQLSEGAVVAGRTIKDANAAVAQYAGKKEGLTGCAISFKESARKLSMVLDGPITGVKNTGLFDTQTLALRTGRLSSQRRQSRSLARDSFSGRAERESCLRTRSKPVPDGACISTP